MTTETVLQFLKKGEGVQVEFKESKTHLPKTIFETVCAFLNRNGGHIFLGVKDDGSISGIQETSLDIIKDQFVSTMNNTTKIAPTFYLDVKLFKVENKNLLYIFVPESSQVHRCNGKIFDRNEDGDFDITNNTNLVANLYLRKQSSYTENNIFPYAEMSDLDKKTFNMVRRLANGQTPNHPWVSMSDKELLKSTGLYLRDIKTGEEGLTLGAILIFGTEQLIQAALPHHKTDALLRKINTDRYDDRDDIRVNLIYSYDRLMHFIAKHLNDSFYLEGTQRISLRDTIFREVVTNLLIHREFANPFPAKLIIEQKRVVTENANKAHGKGIIDPQFFSPHPKNPKIAKVFKEIGLVDELGSGIRNTFKYTKKYTGADPVFIEDDVFTILIPMSLEKNDQVCDQASDQASDQALKILSFCKKARSLAEIQEYMKYKHRNYFKNTILNPLIERGLLKLTIPEKPTSPNQKYYSVNENVNMVM